jgi:hypothetical protein
MWPAWAIIGFGVLSILSSFDADHPRSSPDRLVGITAIGLGVGVAWLMRQFR